MVNLLNQNFNLAVLNQVYAGDVTYLKQAKAECITCNDKGSYTVSVSAPLNNKQGAMDLCNQLLPGARRVVTAGIHNKEYKFNK